MLRGGMQRCAPRVAAGAMALVLWSVGAAAAPAYSGWGLVRNLEAGWAADTMSVLHSAPQINPGACSVTTAGYATSPDDPGRALYQTLLLSALLNRREVNILADGCVFEKPKVIGVSIR